MLRLPPVLIGSHLDTQANGGRFDGILGVLSGIEILRTLDRLAITTRRAIEVVNWTNEEGARFQPPMLCSLGFSGQQSVAWVYDRRDKDGVRFKDALDAIGYCGEAPVGGRAIDSYFELHIEQGPKLDAAGRSARHRHGRIRDAWHAHLGARRDLSRRARRRWACAATRWSAPRTWPSRSTRSAGATRPRRARRRPRASILRPTCRASSPTRPSSTSTSATPPAAALADMASEIEAVVAESARRSRTDIAIAERWGFGGFEFDPDLVGLVRETASRLGVASMDIRSQAGHDAYHMAKVCPTTMLFTPCLRRHQPQPQGRHRPRGDRAGHQRAAARRPGTRVGRLGQLTGVAPTGIRQRSSSASRSSR